MSGDLRAAVEWADAFYDAFEAGGMTQLDHGHEEYEARMGVILWLRSIPEGAVLVTEETLAAALLRIDVDGFIRPSAPDWYRDQAAAILRHLREQPE